MIWKTGRTRTLTLTGSLWGAYGINQYIDDSIPADRVKCIDEPQYEFSPPNAADIFEYHLSVMGSGLNWGISVHPETNLPNYEPCVTGELKTIHAAMVTITLRGESQELDLSEIYAIPGSNSISIAGTWTYSIPVEEYVEFPLALDPILVDADGFVNWGGAAENFRLTGRGARFFERPVPEAVESLAFHGATGTVALSHVLSGTEGFGYDVQIDGNTTVAKLGGSFGASFTGGAGADYVRTIGYTAGEATCTGTATSISLDIDPEPPNNSSFTCFLGMTQAYRFDGRFRLLGTAGTTAHPGTFSVDWISHKEDGFDTLSQIPVSGGVASTTRVQRSYAYDCNLCGQDQTGISKFERTHCRANVSGDFVATGDDPRDIHLPFQLYPWPAMTLAHAGALTVSGPGELTSEADALGLSESCWEGYRYLSVPYTFSAERTLTLTVGGKEFKLKVTEGEGTATIDLCRPSNTPSGAVWTRDGRWPLEDGPTSGPDESSMGDAEKGWTFGILSRPDEVTVDGLLEEETLSLGPLQLVREGSAEARVLIPFMNDQRVWESPSDTTYGDFDLSLIVDGKQCGPVCGRFRVQGPMASTYAWPSVQGVSDFIDGLLKGWNGTTLAAPSTSPRDPDNPEVKLLTSALEFQYCDPYLWDGAQWRDQTHLNASSTATIWGTVYAHEVTIYPGIGDPLDADRSDGGAFPLRCSGVYRGQAEGLCFETGGAAKAGIGVRLVTWPDAAGAGGGTSDARGTYRTNAPFGKGNDAHRTRLAADGTKNEAWTPQNRYAGRTDFLGIPEPSGRCFLRIHSDLRRALGVVSGGTLWLWFFNVGQPSADVMAEAWDTEVPAEWCAGAWRPGHGMLLLLGDGGNALLYRLDTEGGTPSMSTDLGAATSGDIFSTDDVTFRAYRLDGGTVKGHVFDVAGNEISAFDTNLEGLDEEFIACDQSVARANGVEVALTAVQGGTRKVFLSSDGRNFT